MRRLILSIALILALAHPVAAEKLWLTTAGALSSHSAPTGGWGSTGLTGVIVIIPNGTGIFPYTPTSWEDIHAQVLDIRLRTIGLKLYLGFWSNDMIGSGWGSDPSNATLFEWNNPQWDNTLLPNLRALSHAAMDYGVQGFVNDDEIYLGTPGANGGVQNPQYAWINHWRVPARGQDFSWALRAYETPTRALQLGSYCYYRDLARSELAWTEFRSAVISAGPTYPSTPRPPYLMLDESFVGTPPSQSAVRAALGNNVDLHIGEIITPSNARSRIASAPNNRWFYDQGRWCWQ